MSGDYDRQVVGFQFGTVAGTIFYTPINFSAEIYKLKYVLPGGTGTVAAELRNVRSGSLVGTIDTVILTPGAPIQNDLSGEHPITKVEGGQYLVGIVVLPTGAAGSIEGVVEYKYVPGRLVGG